MKDLVASELRRLHRKHQQVDRRTSLVDIGGKVKPGSQDMKARTVVLVIGRTRDGQDVLSPPVRWQATGAGALKMHATPADDEQMVLHSPSGTVGNGSMAHWGTYDQDHQPPSTSKDEVVLEFGKCRIVPGKDSLVLQYDTKSKVTLTSDSVKAQYGDDVFVEIKDKTIVGRVPGGGTVKLGEKADKDQTDPVMTVTGPSTSVQAKTG